MPTVGISIVVKDIFVVTHTEATHHLADIVGGWHDSHLTARGLSQAEAVLEHLGALIGRRDVEIYSSDLRGASQTAAPPGRTDETPSRNAFT